MPGFASEDTLSYFGIVSTQINAAGPSIAETPGKPGNVSFLSEWLRPNLSLQEAGCVMAVWIAMQMSAQIPTRTPYSALFMLGILFFIALARNVAAITVVVLLTGIAIRIGFPISAWEDQHWTQWYSISSLATGHNIMLRSPWAGMSMAAYLPTGDLFGGLFIALGIQKYWYVWQIITPLLYAVPVALAPSATTLAVFIGLSWFWPYADYTNAGGNLETELAMLIAAIAAYRYGRKTASIIFFAFAAMMRQPAIVIIPFVFILLWQEKDYARMKLFAVLLFLFGGIYIVLDPSGAYQYEYKVYDVFQDSFFHDNQGLLGNYSISSIPHAFGIDDQVPWNAWKSIYFPLTAGGLLTLVALAYKTRKRDTVMFLLVMAPVFVYVLARGYSQLHYVVASVCPMLALAGPASQPRRTFEHYFTRSLAFLILWIGLAPLAIYFVGKAGDIVDRIRPERVLPIAQTILVGADGNNAVIPTPDGTDAHRPLCWMNQGLEFDFAQSVSPDEVRLTGDHVQIQAIKGIKIWWATRTESRGSIWRGTVEYSTDGKTFQPPREFSNTLTYEAFPVTISLPKPSQPVRAIRLRALEVYVHYDQWFVGNVEFLGRR
jgi:hypothetical protein